MICLEGIFCTERVFSQVLDNIDLRGMKINASSGVAMI